MLFVCVPAASSFAAALELVVFPNEEDIFSCLLREIFNEKAGFLARWDDILIMAALKGLFHLVLYGLPFFICSTYTLRDSAQALPTNKARAAGSFVYWWLISGYHL